MKSAIAEKFAVFRKKSLEILAAGLVLSACSFAPRAAASIYTLLPGGDINATASAFPAGGTLLNQISSSFTSSTIDGTVVSSVYSGDASNPYGGLTFTYLLMLSGASSDSASELTVGSYGGALTDVSDNPAGGGVLPSNFTRSLTGGGSTVRFLWSSGGGVLPGENGALVVVQTGAHVFGNAAGGVIDSQTANVTVLAPVPEPEIGSLVAMGLGALFIFRRRSSK